MNLLEWNDAELRLHRNGKLVYRQPAVAHIGTERNRFGMDALRIARLHPQQTNQQYVARLNADPLPVPGKLAANHADLVYLHLLELRARLDKTASRTTPQTAKPAASDRARSRRWKLFRRQPAKRNNFGQARAGSPPSPRSGGPSTRVRRSADANSVTPKLTVAVPGSLTNDQLGVLLGIAQQAGIDIRGFVDSAVLMASTSSASTHFWLLDLHLTRACLTELRADAELVRASAQDLPGCGLMSCLDGWANLLADRFVQETRFDPLHAADTEQQLYNQLYSWSQRGWASDATDAPRAQGVTTNAGDFIAEIRHGDHERRVRVARANLRRKLTQRFQQLAQKLPKGTRLLVAPRSAALPQLLPCLAELGIRAEALPPQALERGFERHSTRISSGELRLVSRLPCGKIERAPSRPAISRATHVLFENRAWPLDDNPFGLPNRGHLGESISKNGRNYQLIAVEPAPNPDAHSKRRIR